MLVRLLSKKIDGARSFQLSGEDFSLIGGEDLVAAAEAWQAALAQISAGEREAFLRFHHETQNEAHTFLCHYSHSVRARIAGYLALGRRCEFSYPWPVVAILGIEQVLTGFARDRFYGALGAFLERCGKSTLSRVVDRTEDVLRRTNRAIFADSVPVVIFALRVAALGKCTLADALLHGPLPPLFDEDCRALIEGLVAGLALPAHERFAALALLTEKHFEREQAIFSHYLGAATGEARAAQVAKVPGPEIVRGKVRIRSHALPKDFDMRDHAARVREFSRIFVRGVTRNEGDYGIARDDVIKKFGR